MEQVSQMSSNVNKLYFPMFSYGGIFFRAVRDVSGQEYMGKGRIYDVIPSFVLVAFRVKRNPHFTMTRIGIKVLNSLIILTDSLPHKIHCSLHRYLHKFLKRPTSQSC